MYRIKTGNCKVFKTGDSGRMELATMGPKTMFGDTSVMQSLKLATADVVADSDVVELYAIEVPILHEILKNNTGLAMRFWKGMATKLSQRLRNLHAPPAKKKKNSKKAIAAENATAGARQAGAGSDGDASADSSFCHKFDLPPQEVVIKGMLNIPGIWYLFCHDKP
jgi:CRP-like cAMP-binding protein